MRTFFLQIKAMCSRYKGQLLSVAAHCSLLLLLTSGVTWSPRVMPYRLPGTAKGVTLLTYYKPGSVHPVTSDTPLKTQEKTKPSPVLRPVPSIAQPEPSHATQSQPGIGAASQSGLGEGDITIALQSYFPYPKPDLSALPRGTKGDVILNAVIDEHGNISELTLLRGLGSPVDESVIATVQQWHYTPAMKNGVPVVSEQELHFHYERG